MSNTDDSNETLKNPWNQFFMQFNIADDVQSREAADYEISSSLKTIWNDVSDDRQITAIKKNSTIIYPVRKPSYVQQQRQQPAPEQFVQFGNNVISVGSNDFHQSTSAKTIVPVSSSDNAIVNNVVNSNSLKGRAITARNGGYIANFGNDRQQKCCSSMPSMTSSMGPSPIITQQRQQQLNQPFELLLQQVHVIVNNGFLDPKILNEPISPDTFDLIQMLIYYVMEYKQTRNFANCDNNPALCTEIKKIFYKINLIQNEIAISQFRHVQQKRVQQEIMQSFSLSDGKYYDKKQNNVQYGSSMSSNGSNGRYSPLMRSSGDLVWLNELNERIEAENHDRENQRFTQHRPDQDAPPLYRHLKSHALPIKFVPSAKNVDKHSHQFTNSQQLHIKSERN